jgi:hypothetical protein
MAEPTIDSAGNTGTGGIATIPPLTGEGSKTPPTPGKGLGAGTPLGGAPGIEPMGSPGAPSKGAPAPLTPKTPEEQQADALAERAGPTLINNLSKILEGNSDILSEDESDDAGAAVEEAMDVAASVHFAQMSDKKIEQLVNHLLDLGWTEKVLKNLIKKSNLEPKEFFKTLVEKIKSSGEAGANEFLKSKM